MKNLLVTGGLGFIGSNFVNYMGEKYPGLNFVIYDKCDYCARVDNVHPRNNVKVVIANIENASDVMQAYGENKIDTIVHFAAQSHVENSFKNSIEFTKTNILGTHTLLECARVYGGIELFLHMSTDEVYGEIGDGDCSTEKSLLNPTNPYAASKAGAEFIVRSYHISYKIPMLIVRGNNVYGPGQYPEKVIPTFIMQLLRGEKITVQGSGKHRRNFIHAHDLCTAIELIMLHGTNGETYNIGVNNEHRVYDVAKYLCEIAGKDIDDVVSYQSDRTFNDYRYNLCNGKLMQLGWEPVRTDFKRELADLYEWYGEHQDRYASAPHGTHLH